MQAKDGMAALAFSQQRVSVPEKYLHGLSPEGRRRREKTIQVRVAKSQKGEPDYTPFPTDLWAVKTRTSKHTDNFWKLMARLSGKGKEDLLKEFDAGKQDGLIFMTSRFTGIPKEVLRQVYAKGQAAWASGHRPGASQDAWARARLFSFVTKGPDHFTADKGLAEQAKKQSKVAKDFWAQASQESMSRFIQASLGSRTGAPPKLLRISHASRLQQTTQKRTEKKWCATFELAGGHVKEVCFGQRGAQDFTLHKTPERWAKYVERHGGQVQPESFSKPTAKLPETGRFSHRENWRDPTTPGALSRFVLWNKPDLVQSVRDFVQYFKSQGWMTVGKEGVVVTDEHGKVHRVL